MIHDLHVSGMRFITGLIISYYTICIEPVPSTAQFMNQRDIMTDSIDCQKLMLTCAKALWYARIIDRWMKHLKLCWQTCGNHTISCRIPQTIICQRLFNIHCKLAVKSGDVCDQISQTESSTLLKHPSNYWHESSQAFSWKSVLIPNANWNISAPTINRITCCTSFIIAPVHLIWSTHQTTAPQLFNLPASVVRAKSKVRERRNEDDFICSVVGVMVLREFSLSN